MRNNDGFKVFAMFAVGVIALLFVVCILPMGCTQPDAAKRILKQSGYTNVEITGWRPFMKADSDTFSTGFEATAPSGERVTGAVTGGWLKGSTIRLD